MLTEPAPLVNSAHSFSFDPDKHEYREPDGTIVPSCTQILEAIWPGTYEGIRQETLIRKSSLGTAVDLACHQLDTPEQGTLDWNTLHPEAMGYVLAYEKFKREQKFVVAGSKIQGIATVRGMKYGYEIDKRGFMGRFATILDLKCAAQEQPLWCLQLAGYELVESPSQALRDAGCDDPHRMMNGWWRCALILRPDGTYKVYQYRDPRDKDMFLCALACVWWGRNHGLGEGSYGRNGQHDFGE